ncbi:MAG: hypothetical protein IJZ40_00430 [Bacteroidaceae bacterium]|nr:hypothetical protein [Bacteroidaceae bacterium]
MKKVIYFLCCIFCICTFVYMVYETWLGIEAENFTFRWLMWCLGAIGWGTITFNVVTKEYKWAAYLCK